ncbi:MAG: 5-formyltetrahydrofolate cyclo-ligase [Desulfovibrionaceae bacterium]|nr:5-formyltetrahydrofolate cyclo-ligase [Desulfovibrionaceae bacterium]
MLSKKELRKIMLEKRKAQPEKLRNERSLTAQTNLLQAPIFQKSQALTLYLALDTEIDTKKLLDQALATHKTVYLPRVVPQTFGSMEWVAYKPKMELIPNKLGILEPAPNYQGFLAEKTSPSFTPDLAIFPGLAFTLKGDRLGFGAGYYDRFLKAHPYCNRVALSFNFQVMPAIPLDVWDQSLDFICTEEGLFKCPERTP